MNIKRVGRRNNNLQWFKVPAKTYFEPNAIRYLADMPDVERVTIVTDATMTTLGFVDKIIDVLNRRPYKVALQIIDQVEPEPSVQDRAGGRRADAPLPARHDHRARRRLAHGRREGHVAAVRAPGDRLLRPQAEVLRRAQARVQVPGARRARAAGLHPDHVGHRRRGDAVRGDLRPGRRQEVPAGRLRADPVGRDHRPGPHVARCRASLAADSGLRRPDARHRGVRQRLRQRLHRRHGAARHPAHLREPRDVGERRPGRPGHAGRPGEDAQRRDHRRHELRQRVPRHRARHGPRRRLDATTWCTAGPTRRCCPT